MIMFISPAIVAKANALGLESVSDMNGDGRVTMEDVNLCAAKQGVNVVMPVNPDAVTDHPVVAKALVQSVQ